ncbi:MAG: T9SS type A sorting domain-containing protein [Bacteroidota bacterium]
MYFLIDSEDEALQVQIELYDVQGRLMTKKVVEHTEEAHKLELTTFAEGVYFYRVSAGAGYLKTGKIVVIK